MRIAVWHNLPSGGGKRALYHHIKGLVARGHKIEVWRPARAEREYLPLSELAEEHVVEHDAVPTPNWRWDRLAVYHLRQRSMAALAAHCQRCAEQIHAKKFDVLFSGNSLETAVAPIARQVQLPSLLYHQEPQRLLYEARPTLPWTALPVGEAPASWPRWTIDWLKDFDANLATRLSGREERESAAAFDLLLVNSAFSRESILRAYGLDAKICYLGIDTETFRGTGRVRENFVVGLGAVQWHKGIETAIEALGTLPATRRPRLLWIGNVAGADYAAELRESARAAGVELEIKTLIPDAELIEALGRATAMIYTSHLEPFGFAPLEANACATPVVAVAEGGVRETIKHEVNGLLVPDRDPTALGQMILRLLDDPALARRLGEAGAEIVHRDWTWEKSVDQLEGHLLALIDRAKAAPGAAHSQHDR